jgi:DNA-binding Lrp family transcriptional regulator
MTTAFVLINIQSDAEDKVLERLKKLASIKEIYVTDGAYNILAKIEAETMEKLKEIIEQNIRTYEKIKATLTMIVMEK